MTAANAIAAVANANNKYKIIFKNYDPFNDCISKIHKTQVDNAKAIDAVISLFNLLEYSDNYFKTSGNLFQDCRDDVALMVMEIILMMVTLLILLIIILLIHLNLKKKNGSNR